MITAGAKSGSATQNQFHGLIQVRREVATRFGRTRVAQPRKQPQHHVVDHRQRMRGMTRPHAAPIFTQRYIPAIVQAAFNALVTTRDFQQPFRSGFLRRQTGDPIHHFVRDLAGVHLRELAF